jgi:predicted DNA-binding transcriptional regulator YafY
MPITKNPYRRYQILDSCFQNTQREYTIDTLLQKVNDSIVDNEYGQPITLRQLRSDISFMKSQWGIEFSGELDGRKTVYRYADPSFSIYQQSMPEHQKEAVLSSIEFLKGYTENNEMRNLLDILETANISLENQYNARKIIGLDVNDDYSGNQFKSLLAGYIQDRKVLSIEYQSFHSPEPKKYVFHPQYLKCYNNRWFLVGHISEDLSRITIFALDRIHNIKVNGKFVYYESAVDWGDYFMDMIGVTNDKGKKVEEVVLHFFNNRGKYVETKPLHHSQRKATLIQKGVHEIKLKLIINQELEAELLRFGKDVKVIQPKSLADKLADIYQQAIGYYK